MFSFLSASALAIFMDQFWNQGYLLVMHPSSARLGSAQIQLELGGFQLGLARLVSFLSQLALQKLFIYEPRLVQF